ncbi:MAG TPA: hypothetical protein VFE33_14700 [Thermoanaerobaculia bacterium]|nr:hypothetical protein [Thermoanaerobaculia bacterium]
MRDREHPHLDLLLRFLGGQASKSETRAVVRHLLAGCGACTATIRKTWDLPEWPSPPPTKAAPRFQRLNGQRA